MTKGDVLVKLAELLTQISVRKSSGTLDLNIEGISQDSRSVRPGDLFLCIKGFKTNGHHYLKQAADDGAVAAVVSEWPAEDYGLTIIQVEEVNGPVIKAIAGAFYGYPDRRLKLIGVIGTNGKTTSTYLVKSVLEAAGHSVGLIGTIANLIKDRRLETSNTTPGVLELQKLFAMMVEAGVEYVVMEVSSHSIDQGRVSGLEFIGGIFTNITQDHLDYHGTFEEYFRVKSSFFRQLPTHSWAAINRDDPHAEELIAQISAKVITYGVKEAAAVQADVRADSVNVSHSGVSFMTLSKLGRLRFELDLMGYFNVYNSLGAIAAGLAMGIDLETIKRGLEKVTGVPGRFEAVPGAASFGVIVDYAHTPDGLENILNSARGLTDGRVLLVFGCGGDRDRTKRPQMGALAALKADFTIITSDNPRSEDPRRIIGDIEAGLYKANPAARYLVEADRAVAIRKIIAMAEDSDIVVIAGKGHETYQIFADRTIHFDDREIAREALEERSNGRLHA
jgi:UDP-N-acetylmuramoyl-L-alanyl-D-glutamate--2,6-diaminopimelate ligase